MGLTRAVSIDELYQFQMEVLCCLDFQMLYANPDDALHVNLSNPNLMDLCLGLL